MFYLSRSFATDKREYTCIGRTHTSTCTKILARGIGLLGNYAAKYATIRSVGLPGGHFAGESCASDARHRYFMIRILLCSRTNWATKSDQSRCGDLRVAVLLKLAGRRCRLCSRQPGERRLSVDSRAPCG